MSHADNKIKMNKQHSKSGRPTRAGLPEALRLRIALLLILLSTSFHASSEILHGRVVRITDGDTITVLSKEKQQHKIRLAGIDTPERKQPFGHRAKESLSDMIFNKDVTVEWDKKDRWGRIIGKVLSGTEDVNLKQVEIGHAWWYRRYAHEQSTSDQELYKRAEDKAKHAGRGLWREPSPVPPWDWRKGSARN